MNSITQEIERLMNQVKDFKAVGVDPKARNKVTARLEEAWLWSKELIKIDASSFPVTTEKDKDCICPDGVRVMDCPVHGVAN